MDALNPVFLQLNLKKRIDNATFIIGDIRYFPKKFLSSMSTFGLCRPETPFYDPPRVIYVQRSWLRPLSKTKALKT